MAITHSLDTDIGKVRFVLGDNVDGEGIKPGGSNLQDEEIQFFLDMCDSWQRAVPVVLRACATMWSTKAAWQADSYSEPGGGQMAQQLIAAAQAWETSALLATMWSSCIGYHEKGAYDIVPSMIGETEPISWSWRALMNRVASNANAT